MSRQIVGGKNEMARTTLISNEVFNFNQTMEGQVLEKVRRENTIRVEKRAKGTSGNVTISMARGV